MVDDGDALAELIGLFHVVRGEQDRLPVGVEVVEDLPHGDAALRIEAGGGLVEEQHGRSMHDGAGDHQPLRHAARQARAPAWWRVRSA